MRPFVKETGVGLPLPRANVDTDQIIPKQFLKRIERTGYGPFLFNDWRYDPASGEERADFALNASPYRGARVLVTGRNFGCGSSREHAVWALTDYGFRAVIAPSFGDIFRGNAGKAGLLTVELPEDVIDAIIGHLDDEPGAEVTVDLEASTVTSGDIRVGFGMDPFERRCFLEGLDDIGLTLEHEAGISAFEAKRPAWLPDLRRAGLADAAEAGS